jgi:chromosome segregation ATPase
MTKLTRVCCLLLICCVAHGCAEFKQGFVEGQEEGGLRRASDLTRKGMEALERGDAKFTEAWNKLDEDLAGARALADEASESYGVAAECARKAADIAEYMSRLDLPEWRKDYHRAKAAQYRNAVEQMKQRRAQVAALAVSKSLEEARWRVGPLKQETDKLMAENQQLEEKISRIEAEHNIVPPAAGRK